VQGLRYYDPFTHYGMFGIPPYLREVISKARVLTDEQPFLWEA